MNKQYVINTTALTKKYGKSLAVDNVNLNIEKGSIYGLIGRNGAGKTTILKMVAGLAKQTKGDIVLFQKEKGGEKLFSRIGALIEAPGLYPDLNAYDNLRLKAMCIGLYKDDYIKSIIEEVGLAGAVKKKVKHYSLGMKQRLGIGMALIGNPDLLVLDEPINGLDPQGIAEIRKMILKLNRERNITILISSHILEELSKITTHIGIINKGVLLEEVTKDELTAKCSERIELKTDNIQKAVTELDLYGIAEYKVVDNNMIRIYDHLDEVAKINKALVNADVDVQAIGMKTESLENYFIKMTNGGVK